MFLSACARSAFRSEYLRKRHSSCSEISQYLRRGKQMIFKTAPASLKLKADERDLVRIGCSSEGTPSATVQTGIFCICRIANQDRKDPQTNGMKTDFWLFLRRTTAEPSPNGTDDGDASPVRITASQHFGQGARKAAVSRPSTVQAGRRRISKGDAPSEVRM